MSTSFAIIKDMNLHSYLQMTGLNKAAFAREIGVSSAMLYQFEKDIRPVPAKYGVAIERATGGKVTRQEMFPNDWRRYWPELERRRASKGEKP